MRLLQELPGEHGLRQLCALQLLVHLLHEQCQGGVGDLLRTPSLLRDGECGRQLQRALGALGIHQNPPLHGIFNLLPGTGNCVTTPCRDEAGAPNQIVVGLAEKEVAEQGNGGHQPHERLTIDGEQG